MAVKMEGGGRSGGGFMCMATLPGSNLRSSTAGPEQLGEHMVVFGQEGLSEFGK